MTTPLALSDNIYLIIYHSISLYSEQIQNPSSTERSERRRRKEEKKTVVRVCEVTKQAVRQRIRLKSFCSSSPTTVIQNTLYGLQRRRGGGLALTYRFGSSRDVLDHHLAFGAQIFSTQRGFAFLIQVHVLLETHTRQ